MALFRMTVLRRQAYKIVDSMPIGTEFSTEDIFQQLTCQQRTHESVAIAMRMNEDVVNINTDTNHRAIWKKIK